MVLYRPHIDPIQGENVIMRETTIDATKDERDFMLTTKDNPFNPWTDYERWEVYDRDHGYFTPEYQARIAITSFDLTDEENNEIINQAIEEIIDIDQRYGIGIGYCKAYEP